jgi:hypothetical protein
MFWYLKYIPKVPKSPANDLATNNLSERLG